MQKRKEKLHNLRILHLSDTHFGQPDNDGEQSRILQGITKAIDKHQIKADLVFFTGDLSFSGSPTQFQQGQNWLQKIQELSGGKIVICPGNHDIDREKADTTQLRTSYGNEEAFSINNQKVYSKHPHAKGFLEWYKSASDTNDCFLKLWDNNPFLSKATLSIQGLSVHIIAFNTAIFSCKEDDEKKLCIDIAAFNSALNKSNAENELIICLGHHPINWLTEWNASKVEKLMGQETGPHLYFHGHLHKQQAQSTYSSQGQGFCSISGGATYQGSKWPQYFSLLEVNLKASTIIPNTYTYDGNSGLWLPSAKESRPLTVRLPKIVESQNENNNGASDEKILNLASRSSPNEIKFVNPFDNVASNSLDAHIIPKLFVDENNFLNRISKPFDSLLEGQRGTGKTMLFRYLSLDVQASIQKKRELPILETFRREKIYVGIYSRFSNAGFNRSDYETINSPERREVLFYHRATLFLLSDLIASCATIAVEQKSARLNCNTLSRTLNRVLRTQEFDGIEKWDDLSELTTEICDDLISQVDEHLGSLLPGGTETNFNPWLSLSTSLKQIMRKLYKILDLKAPFFLLLDDFDTLNSEQQGSIFKVAREREHSLVCFKYGIMTLGQKNTMAGEGITYREGDDYDHIPLQWHDKGLSGSSGTAGNYKETVIKIANKRLETFGWHASIKFNTLYKTWTHGNRIREEIRKTAEAKYYNTAPEKRHKSFTDFWSKRGDAFYFRHLRSYKIEHQYAGPDVIVDLSSGIFRQFLEINSRIVSSALDKKWSPDSKDKIGPGIQNSQIRVYAREMLRSLGESSGDTSYLSHCDYDITSIHLINLSNSLISLFSDRLYSGSKDAEIIAISVKGDFSVPSFAKSILDIAVRESVLQRRSIDYSAKTASVARLPTYYLNRRLAPEGNLGLKMQGRIELSIEAIELAAKDTESFIQHHKYKSRNSSNTGQGDFFDR